MFYIKEHPVTLMNQTVTHGCLSICDALRDFGSVTIWRLHGRSNACKCNANALFYLHIVFIRLHELAWHSNGSIKC